MKFKVYVFLWENLTYDILISKNLTDPLSYFKDGLEFDLSNLRGVLKIKPDEDIIHLYSKKHQIKINPSFKTSKKWFKKYEKAIGSNESKDSSITLDLQDLSIVKEYNVKKIVKKFNKLKDLSSST